LLDVGLGVFSLIPIAGIIPGVGKIGIRLRRPLRKRPKRPRGAPVSERAVRPGIGENCAETWESLLLT
jgi:hypothetical protein